MVIGTTGWYSKLPDMQSLAQRRGASLLYGTNFSIGVQLLLKLATDMAETLKPAGYQFRISETHHITKLDAPSGTAISLSDTVRLASGQAEVPVESIRHGDAVGLHIVEATGPGDKILLTHESHSRIPYAEGAVRAAEWLAQSRPGVYDFREIFDKI